MVWKKLDFLILNSSGGLEQGKAADYAMRPNLNAQINLVNSALPLMSVGGRIVFGTSHLAHFYGTGSSSPLAFHADAPLYIPGAKTRIPAEPVTCEHICDST
jgi:NAD(P)-dependent dehydrogenase (short-subunit alcohol dehydrogenase family)